ncbi:MAG: peptidyl-prolyl cis-trans isomerase [Campylobacterota bacterium]|nr:peptidyl-prolyl cis-trans isomerase [Campylobacterota bacterium]
MKNLLLLSVILLATLTHAKIYNAVAIVVDGEPITTQEISAVQSQLGVSKKEAQDMLIDNRLQKHAMKNISVSEDEIDKRVALIAKQNNLSLKKMQRAIKEQGQSWNKFRDQTKTSIQKQKFFRTKIAQTISEPSEDELKIFYRNNRKLFSMPSNISVIEFSAPTADKIQAVLDNDANQNGVKQRRVKITGKDITPQLLAMISQSEIGEFTPAFNNGSAYVTYKIIGKGKKRMKPYEDVKKSVAMAWKRKEQESAVKDYFKKMKSSATIEIIRP